MQREIQVTADGSHTLAIASSGATYHSRHGAIGESRHVFIEAGLQYLFDRSIQSAYQLLEIGFGTGLNALLSFEQALLLQKKIRYHAIEPFPVTTTQAIQLNHGILLNMEHEWEQLHAAPWQQPAELHPLFVLEKTASTLADAVLAGNMHAIYFDAFSPTEQPELWTTEVFVKLYACLSANGILLTYCSKSAVRKTMEAAGFKIEKIPGPWGKREMVRATK